MAASATEITTHLPTFRALLKEWSDAQPSMKGFISPLGQGQAEKNVVVAFRTRPPLDGEAETKFHALEDKQDEEEKEKHDSEPCLGITPKSAEPGVFVAHVPGKKWNGYTLTHKEYRADLAFGPDIDNEEVYERCVVANNILPLVLSGGVGCILAYGQTSSGKTYTMEGIEACISRDLFDAARAAGKRLAPDVEDDDLFDFSVTFLELLGKHATDLVDQDKGEVAIHEDKVGNVRPRLVYTTVRTSEELQTLITSALSHRRVVATDRNATSSRSHAVLTVHVKNKTLPYAEEGQLVLVDLAGSERYEDSKGHDKQRMKESRENNESLMNLKECVRAKAKMAAEDGFVHIPWRSNKLTMLLKPLFDIESRQPSTAVIIAHVSPHIQDSVHSTNTLSYAAPFLTVPPKPRGPAPYDAKDPRTWDTERTRDWLRSQFGKRVKQRMEPEKKVKAKHSKLAGKALDTREVEVDDLGLDIEKVCPDGYTGKNLGVLYTTQFAERCVAARTTGKLEDVKEMSVEVIGQLFYLVMTAKTRTRNAVMKSRKPLVAEAYGDVPVADLAEENLALNADNAIYQEAYKHFEDTWGSEKDEVMRKAREAGDTSRYNKLVREKVEA